MAATDQRLPLHPLSCLPDCMVIGGEACRGYTVLDENYQAALARAKVAEKAQEPTSTAQEKAREIAARHHLNPHKDDVAEEIASALTVAILSPSGKDSWLPIETAPKEPLAGEEYGPEILTWGRAGRIVAMWNGENWVCRNYGYDELGPRKTPTHWQPLPHPPGEAIGRTMMTFGCDGRVLGDDQELVQVVARLIATIAVVKRDNGQSVKAVARDVIAVVKARLQEEARKREAPGGFGPRPMPPG